jgi:disulfide bond formation protein DsbB
MGRARSAALRRTRRAWPPALITLYALVLVLFGVAVSLAIAGHTGAGLSFAALPVAFLGLVIARRQPANRIAWLLLGFSGVYAHHALEPAHITLWLSPDAGHPASPADAS